MIRFLQDVRIAMRVLLQRPGFALLAVLTLAVGTGATTLIFTVFSGVLLKPLGYQDPATLVALHVRTEKTGDRWGFSYPDFLDCLRECRSFDGMAAWTYSGGTVSSPGQPEYVDGRQISSGLFSVLHVSLAQGRSFLPAEDRRGSAPVAIISTRLWQLRYASNPQVVGMPLTYDGKAYTVVGVAPPGLQLDGDVDIFTPLGQTTEPRMQYRAAYFLHVLARLRNNTTLAQAQTELALFSENLAKQYPDSKAGMTLVPHTLQSELVQNVRPTLWLLLGAVSLVLLIACVNIASLLLTRVVSREHEFALRLALGASRWLLIRQCFVESGILGICGGLLGLLCAMFGTRPFLQFWPGRLPRAEEVHVDWRVLLFSLSLSILTALIFGLMPALRANKSAIEKALRSRSRNIAGSARKPLSGFVVCQIALAFVLLTSAGIIGRTLLHISSLNPGLDVHNVLTARVAISPEALSSPKMARAAWKELMDSLRADPAVQSVALTDTVPMREGQNVVNYWATTTPPPPNQAAESLAVGASPDYLKVMRIPLLRGRFVDETDGMDSRQVVVIDENMARHAFPGADPVGKLVWIPSMGPRPVLVVGVVGHVRHWGLADDDLSRVHDQFYYPLGQVPDQLMKFFSSIISVVVRTNIPPLNTIDTVQREARGAMGDQSLYELRTMEQLVSASLDQQRFLLFLFAIYSGVALLLACVGIYGVIAYLTSQRVPEIGVRIALGASRSDILGLVLRQSLVIVLAGIGVGILASFATGRILQGLVPEMQPSQAAIFVVVLPLLLAAALFASYIPARRAAKVDPMVALRYE
ncbi:MAG TPA: ABC transporter permease [Terriglobales bacterium]|nr:ABC transporter permease [Terriglobales bacterium]